MTQLLTQDTMQANLGFVVSQTSHIEAGVYALRFPEIQYPSLIPVDTSANPWVTSVTYYSMDRAGKADWINGRANDIPLVGGVSMDKQVTTVHMAGIGYDYSLEEVNQARLLNMNLPNEKASAARRAYEEMIDQVVLEGDAPKNFSGLFNYPGVPSVAAPNGSGGSPLWANKTPDEINADINNMLIGVHSATNTVAMADTLLLPYTRMLSISSLRLGDTAMTILEFIRQNNVYTATTGQPLTIRGVRGLDTRGAGNTARMIAYRRNPEVLKLHIPMPHQFLPMQVVGMQYMVPGIFRLGGLDIRLPKEIRYMDGI